jgi:PAS domain S-box-containing protein
MTPNPDLPDRGPRAIPYDARLLSLIAANILDMVVFVDLEGRIQWLNEAVEKQFGYTREELIGAHVYTLQAPGKNSPGIWSPGGTGELLEKWAGVIVDRRRDGSEFTARVESFLVRDEHGSVTGIASISRDISEKVRAEKLLRESEARYREFFATSRDGVFITSTDGKWIDFNDAALELLGYDSREELSGVPVSSVYANPEERSVLLASIEKHGSVREHPARLRRRDGTIIDTLITSALRRSADGPGGEYFGTFRDITERRRAEESLRESEERFRMLTSSAQDAIIIMDGEGKISFWNHTAEKIFGYTAGEAIGKELHPLLAPGEYLEACRRGLDAYRLTGEGPAVGRTIELTAIKKDGSVFPIELSLSSVKLKGMWHAIGILRDITARKRTEEALRVSRQIIEGIINAIPVRVFWKDKNLVYLGCNAVFARDAGFADPKDIIGKDDYQMGWRDQAELYRDDDRHVIESGSSKSLIEEPQTTPEGNTITLLTSKIPLRGSNGEVIGVLGTYVDITERKRAEEALRESEEKYRVLFECSRDALMTLEPPSWVFTACNQSTVAMFRAKSAEEFVSYGPWELSPERQPDGRASAEKAREMIETAMREGSNYFEWTHTRVSGEEFPATVLLTRMEHYGKRFLQATVRDVTELKDYQATLEERNRELEIISSAALTREFRIKELRDEIRVLKRKIEAGGEET